MGALLAGDHSLLLSGTGFHARDSLSQGAVGFALIAVGASAVAGYQLWEEWVDVILGLWLIVSPWIIGFGEVSVLRGNAILSGAAVAILAGWVLIEGQGRMRRPKRD